MEMSPSIPAETISLCAKLLWLITESVCPAYRKPLRTINIWNVRLISTHIHRGVIWAVFEDSSTRYVCFRGHVPYDPLPLPHWKCVTDQKLRVNVQQYNAWLKVTAHISSCLKTHRKIVLSGYSMGAAAAILTSRFLKTCATCVFSPFPFCEPTLIETMRGPLVQVWMYKDWMVHFYSPLFQNSRHNVIVLVPPPRHGGFCARHRIRTICMSITNDPESFKRKVASM